MANLQDITLSSRLKEWKKEFFSPGKSWNTLDDIIADLEIYENQVGLLVGKIISVCDKTDQAVAEATSTKG